MTVFIYSHLPAPARRKRMIRISTNLHEIEIVEAVNALGRGKVKDLIWLLAKYTNDEQFLDECAEMFRQEVSRNAQLKKRST
ncbi:MAG: hypothetical protein O7G84_17785 [Gammaproteobacteria bacterium]|nr:hypothetical protein [Gammaproteobacteria bacterium]